MLIEAVRHALIRCPGHLKDLGVLYDLIALQVRARRLRRAWSSHVQNTQRAVIDLAVSLHDDPSSKRQKTCAILGSGLLLEVPIDALCTHYEKVFCVDLFHMPEVRRRCASLANVELIEADLTGCFAYLSEIAHDRDAELPIPESPNSKC